ncbi:hypothetical protein COU49_00850 [Candidatus Nomurabacteria bacterium CG10_big_fil_rev_8_21_14_0_10_35_16]|uniref:Uncharacterized protein n=1 Tax=Candidatus Nomurabacteria bacterium CG10_big_fil_rev_8_21_14_0_10_35_16 TaxID=1974731 RepID=A0A2H0TBU2_9BACT|nr:MAG: hypothetical protein COU49_00850 [Candidatus Nomurabacteria bacterium CG10_big_fil_rev_8_21_14_0_10_35_16]
MDNNNKDFYLKKVDQRGKISVWLVDGKKIRDNLDEEFTNFGQHFCFSYIPENEFWLDNEASPNEQAFFIDHLLVEKKLMESGISRMEAIDKANKKEAFERAKAGDLMTVKKNDGNLDMNKIHKQFLGKTNEKISIWLVDARLVRSTFDPNFTEGGHDLVYNYVPPKEVWIDDDIFPEERLFVLLHELFERELMKKGEKYQDAHKKASQLEWATRHNQQKLIEELKKLGWTKILYENK